jgi:hypothetical protein
MTATDECDHGELIGMPCPPCDNARGQRLPTLANDVQPWSEPFRAAYGGLCGGCGFALLPGDLIRSRYLPDEDRREYRHKDHTDD